ncbi:kinase-like domain-containing protein [Melanogaster broomeanus]|nr:kinase-like domain-containing protein [Melanogaster broomeanus]
MFLGYQELSQISFEFSCLFQRLRRERGIWRRLNHPNIVPLLGTADGSMFNSKHPCMVSMWMPHGTLKSYIRESGTGLAIGDRLQLVIHAKNIVHGDLHPDNVLIDGEYNPRLTDFGLTQVLGSVQDQMAYLQTTTLQPGAIMWSAPELLRDDPGPKLKATVKSDIYSLGSIILFVLSGALPWPTCTGIQQKLKDGQNPQRPESPAISDEIWNFIQKCWSPLSPSARPTAQEFSRSY